MNALPWWTRSTVYQVYPRSFADGDGDGIGDLSGLLGRLDHLADLGVDVLWLSPIYASPQIDNGYDVSDYEAIDPVFGTDAELDELIDGLHRRGMRLMMDLVVNHTSDQHAWFTESRSSVDSPKRDWYWWRSPREGHVGGTPGAEPTGWRSFFSGPAWTWDEATGEYYLHYFAPEQPDLNWENPEVRRAVYAMMNRWLDRGVDGFRMDVINMISKVVPLTEAGGIGDRNHEFLAEMHREVFAGREERLITVGEMPMVTAEEARLFTDQERAELDMVFTFEHMDLDSGPGGKFDVVDRPLPVLKANLAHWQEQLSDVGWNSLYWGNHDQPRAVSRFGDDSPEHRVASAKAVATALHMHRGTPYVYQGEEIGMTNAVFASADEFHDLESVNHHREALAAGESADEVLAALRVKSRDNARTPVQWDDSANAGFTDGRPWMPVNDNHRLINVAAQADDPDSVLAHYRRLIALRKSDETVQLGRFRLLLADHPDIWAFTRSHDDDQLLVLVNMSGTEQQVDLAELGGGAAYDEVVLSNLTVGGDPLPTSASERLQAWEAVVLRRG